MINELMTESVMSVEVSAWVGTVHSQIQTRCVSARKGAGVRRYPILCHSKAQLALVSLRTYEGTVLTLGV